MYCFLNIYFESFIHTLIPLLKVVDIYIFCLREHDVTTVSSLQILRNFDKFPAINIAPFIIILHFKWGGFQRKNYFTWEEVSPRGYRSRQRKGHHFCTGLVRTFVKDLLHTGSSTFFLIFLLLEVFPWLIGTLCLILCFPSPLGVHWNIYNCRNRVYCGIIHGL